MTTIHAPEGILRTVVDLGVPVVRISAVLPTYRRGEVLLDTVRDMLALKDGPDEILLIDQTEDVPDPIAAVLQRWQDDGRIRWIRQSPPSIPRAMNRGLLDARHDVVLYLDDDIKPWPQLVSAHRAAHADAPGGVVAGRVLQPWHQDDEPDVPGRFSFAQPSPAWVDEFMGGNVSMDRALALRVGGFDACFEAVAYRFEAEMAHRLRAAGARIRYAPQAAIRHLKVSSGGTRRYATHDRTWRPDHAVGAYYFLLRTRPKKWLWRFLARPWRTVCTRAHLRAPWWIPVTFFAEVWGQLRGIGLWLRGPRLLPEAQRQATRGTSA